MSFDDAISEHHERKRAAAQVSDVVTMRANEIRSCAAEILGEFVIACRQRGIEPTPLTYYTLVKNWRGKATGQHLQIGLGWRVLAGLVVRENGELVHPNGTASPDPIDFGAMLNYCPDHPDYDVVSVQARWIGPDGYGLPGSMRRFKSTYPNHSWIPMIPIDDAEFASQAPLADVLAYFVSTGGSAPGNQTDIYG